MTLSPSTLAALSTRVAHGPASEPTISDRVRAGVTTRWSTGQAGTHGPRGVLAQVGNAVRDRFRPLPSLNHRDLSKAGAMGRQMLNEFLGSAKQNNPIENMKEDLTPGARQRDYTQSGRPSMDSIWNDIKLRICLGACGQSHEIARLTTIVRVDHDSRGAPFRAELQHGSGYTAFDDYCLGAISLKLDVPHLPGEPVPEQSMWRFDQVVYRFSRAERILDPAFLPPGRKDSDRSDIFGDASVTAEVALLAVTYRDAASLPGVLK